ncbi:MAG: hypothetical protein ACWGNV_02215 [Bacteroidales bacterium]
MKKLNIILSIALVALTTAIWAQEPTLKKHLLPDHSMQAQVITADYRSNQNGVEAFIHRLQDWLSQPQAERGYYENPEVSMSFFFENAEVIYESGSNVETWMEVPFEEQLDEELVTLEDWMTLPFDDAGAEVSPELEAWMTVPFEGCLIEEVVALESWMTVPFENELTEEPMVLESWMSDPFEGQLVEEPLAVENWMTRPFESNNGCEEGSWMAKSHK